jgi:hypothetical protein
MVFSYFQGNLSILSSTRVPGLTAENAADCADFFALAVDVV